MGAGATRIAFVLLASGPGPCAWAQQAPVHALHMWNVMQVDPAAAGSGRTIMAALSARQQWVGLEGAPRTRTLMVEAPLRNEHLALGLLASSDEVGPVHAQRVAFSVAYRMHVGRASSLAFGLRGGMDWMQLSLAQVANVEAGDPVFAQDRTARACPTFGFGAYWNDQRGYVGIGVPQLTPYNAVDVQEDGATLTGARQVRRYYAVAGREFRAGADTKVHAWAQVSAEEGAPMEMDLSSAVLLKDRFWLGGTWRSPGALAAFLAYTFQDHLRVGYAYEFSLGQLRLPQNGTHEIYVGYSLKLHQDKTLSPRFF